MTDRTVHQWVAGLMVVLLVMLEAMRFPPMLAPVLASAIGYVIAREITDLL